MRRAAPAADPCDLIYGIVWGTNSCNDHGQPHLSFSTSSALGGILAHRNGLKFVIPKRQAGARLLDYYILFIVGSAATVRAALPSVPLTVAQADKARVAHTRSMDPILDILLPFITVLCVHICQCVRFMAS